MYTALKMLRLILSIILIIPLPIIASGQNSPGMIRSFWKISWPEKKWVITHPFISSKAFRSAKDARQLAQKLLNDSLLDADPDGGQIDAFRHAYWMASLSQKICWKKAVKLGEAHEKGNFRNFKKGRREELYQADSLRSVRDSKKSLAGTANGCRNREISSDSLKIVILDEIQNGNMYVLLKDRSGRFLDCNHQVLDTASFIGIWKIPKCLVASDKGRIP